MSEVQESARRWSGYVCPDCRFIFRVPRDHDGRGLVCPSCKRLLKLPGEDDVLPPLIAGANRPKSSAPGDPNAHARAHYEHAKPSWERDDADEPVAAPEFRRKHTLLWVVGGLVIAALGFGWLLLRPGKERPAPVVVRPPVEMPAQPSGEAAPETLRQPDNYLEFRRETEPIAKRFLEAKTVADMARETVKPEQTEARAKPWYPAGKFEAPGFITYLEESGLVNTGRYSTVQIETRYQGTKPLTFLRTDAGWKIDWESWSGWSEHSWADVLAKRPTNVVRLRATVTAVEYYNFYFSDESRWRSYRLESPDGEQILYGYIERGSALEANLPSKELTTGARLLIDVRFPGDPSARNQVFIAHVANTDWTDFDASATAP